MAVSLLSEAVRDGAICLRITMMLLHLEPPIKNHLPIVGMTSYQQVISVLASPLEALK